ncbi:MAG: ferredoxin, partial [Microcystis panniformis]
IGNQIVTEYAFLCHDLPAISLNCPGEESETIEENSVKTS